MNTRKSRHRTLRAIIIGQFGFLCTAVVALCGVFVFSSMENRDSIKIQQAVNAKHLAALELDEVIDDLLYYGAELSNSLSDESYDAFMESSTRADNFIERVEEPSLRTELRKHKATIEDNAISALDSYVVDDRTTGDQHARNMRVAAAQLDDIVQSNVRYFEQMRLEEEAAILNRSNTAWIIALMVAALCMGTIVAIASQMWRDLIKPIETMIGAISNAAKNPAAARQYQINNLARNEVGDAGAALNKLLDAVQFAIANADTRALEAETAQQRWRALFQESPDAIVLLDPSTTQIIEQNPAMEELLCVGASDFYDDAYLTALELHRHEENELKSFFLDILTKGKSRGDHLSCGLEDRRIPVSVVGVTVPHEGDKAILLHIRDISEQRAYEEKLEHARADALRAAESKSNFLANMSHEIRTPMNGIMGMTEVLANTELSSKQRNFVDIINTSSNALLTIINDILDFSKIDSGQISLDKKSFNLERVVEDVIALIGTRAEEKDLELIVRYQPKFPSQFIGDEGRIRQILVNLVGNAVKFTDSGHVVVDVSGTYDRNNASLKVRINDTGIGIPEEKLGSIFEKFNQVDNSATRKFEGTGLGLSICSMLIEKMGGKIGAESELGNGSVFWFDVSLPLTQNAIQPATFPAEINNSRALIVDDNSVNREILIEQLSGWGLRPVACSSGIEALEAISQASSSNDPFDVIIMDFQMPRIDGISTFSRIPDSQERPRPQCILLSSVDDDVIRLSALEAGINACLTKPARSSELFDAILSVSKERNVKTLTNAARQLSYQPSQLKQTSDSEAADQDTERCDEAVENEHPPIVVAEDNIVNQAVISELLSALGYKFVIAEDGEKAVELVDTHTPEIVLMDISMPNMNGLEATDEIRRRDKEKNRKTIIIGLSANALKSDRDECIEAGMDDYLTKPIDLARLQEGISKWSDRETVGRSVA